MASLPEERLQTLTFFLFLCYTETLLQGPLQVGGGASIYYTHVINTVCTLLSEVPDEKLSLLLQFLWHIW